MRLFDAVSGAAVSDLSGAAAGGAGAAPHRADVVFAVAFTCDGARVLAGARDGALRVYDALAPGPPAPPAPPHGRRRSSVAAQGGPPRPAPSRAVAFSPDARHVAVATDDGGIAVHDLLRGTRVVAWDAGRPAAAVVVYAGPRCALLRGSASPVGSHARGGGRYVVSADATAEAGPARGVGGVGGASVWDAATGAAVTIMRHGGGVTALAAAGGAAGGGRESPAAGGAASLLASGSASGTIRVWDVATLALVHEVARAHAGGVSALAFTAPGAPPSPLVASGGAADRLVRVWRAATGDLLLELRPLRAGAGPVRSLAWAPDGGAIASGGGDGRVRVWDARSGVLLRQSRGHAGVPVTAVAFSPDGTRVASGGGGGSLVVTRAAARGNDGDGGAPSPTSGVCLCLPGGVGTIVWFPVTNAACDVLGVGLCGPEAARTAVLVAVSAAPDPAVAPAPAHGGGGASSVGSASTSGARGGGGGGGPTQRARVPVDAWVADGDAAVCRVCGRSFGPLRRRHHCRACGGVVCDACSSEPGDPCGCGFCRGADAAVRGRLMCLPCAALHDVGAAAARAGAAGGAVPCAFAPA